MDTIRDMLRRGVMAPYMKVVAVVLIIVILFLVATVISTIVMTSKADKFAPRVGGYYHFRK